MTLSKRNSRPISIDDIEYRWAVSSRSQGDSELVTVVVQPPNDGQRLTVDVPCRDPYLNIQEPKPDADVRGITPKLVRRFIDDARSIGWQPEQSGKQFAVQSLIATLRDEGGDEGATCHVCWQCPSCDEWYSDDIEFGEEPPLMTRCDRTRHHSNAAQTNVILFW